MYLKHTAFTALAVATDMVHACWRHGPILWLRKQFAWDYIGFYGIWGYWQNRITKERTAKRVHVSGSGRLHRSWLTGSDWDHDRYPLNTSGLERDLDVGCLAQ